MKTPKVKQTIIPIIIQSAIDISEKTEHLVEQIFNNGDITTAIYKCSNCKSDIEADIGTKQAYCDYCECAVFLDKN